MILDQNRNQLIDTMNASNQVYTNEELSSKIDAMETKLNNVYPVGSIYISIKNTNPGTLYGGTWTSFGTGQTLVGVDTSQTEFATVEKTGGEKTHTLTIAEMPSHDHGFERPSWYISDFTSSGAIYTPNGYKTSAKISDKVSKTGGGGAHNNLQPYITVYMWKRTA